MNILHKIFNLIKKMFKKNQPIKQLNPYSETKLKNNTEFINSIKIPYTSNPKTNKISEKSLCCPGDGLGIQKKITF